MKLEELINSNESYTALELENSLKESSLGETILKKFKDTYFSYPDTINLDNYYYVRYFKDGKFIYLLRDTTKSPIVKEAIISEWNNALNSQYPISGESIEVMSKMLLNTESTEIKKDFMEIFYNTYINSDIGLKSNGVYYLIEKRFGGYGVEGLRTFCDLMLKDLDDLANDGTSYTGRVIQNAHNNSITNDKFQTVDFNLSTSDMSVNPYSNIHYFIRIIHGKLKLERDLKWNLNTDQILAELARLLKVSARGMEILDTCERALNKCTNESLQKSLSDFLDKYSYGYRPLANKIFYQLVKSKSNTLYVVRDITLSPRKESK